MPNPSYLLTVKLLKLKPTHKRQVGHPGKKKKTKFPVTQRNVWYLTLEKIREYFKKKKSQELTVEYQDLEVVMFTCVPLFLKKTFFKPISNCTSFQIELFVMLFSKNEKTK